MKTLFFALSIFIVSSSVAQSTGKFEFKWTFLEDGELETANVKVYSRLDRIVLFTDESYGTETAIIDRTSKSLLELFVDIDEEDSTVLEKYYALSSYETDLEETAYVSEILSSAIESSIYGGAPIKLLPEKKKMFGLSCQKFTFEEEGTKVTGWIALGIHVNISGDYKYFDTTNGMIVEFELTSGTDQYTVTFTGYDPKFSSTDAVYSIIPPLGYEDLDDVSIETTEGEE